MIKREDNIIPVPGQSYEFTNNRFGEWWTRPIPFIGNVPPSMINGQFLFVAYNEIAGQSRNFELYEFVRESTQDEAPILHQNVMSRIKKHDEVEICQYGETLRLCITDIEPEVYGQLYNGMWGTNITEALKRLPLKDFYIKSINNINVINPQP